jgi:hypothetical protein
MTTIKENTMSNRYDELTLGEQAAIDRLVNHMASLPIDNRKMLVTVGPMNEDETR